MSDEAASAGARQRSASIAADRYSLRPLWWGTALATLAAAPRHAANFIPLSRPGSFIESVRLFLEFLLVPHLILAIFTFVLALAIYGCVSLFRGRSRRALSSIAGLAALAGVFVAETHIAFFNPYFWYVVRNQARFEAAARAMSPPGVPAFAVLETRDVSVFIQNVFASIVYDESGVDGAGRLAKWQRLGGSIFDSPESVVHLRGHFFLVWETS